MRASSLAFPLLAAMSMGGALAQLPRPLPPPPVSGYGDLHIPGSEENLGTKAVREAMVNFARCVARRRPKEASDFVLQVSQATWTALEKRIDQSCALEAVADPGEEVRVSTNSQDLLFALAEVLVQKELDPGDPVGIRAAAALPPADAVGTVGECAVRANPTAARDLLKTKLNSKVERQAVRAIMPAVATCLPKGQQVRFDMTTLRGMIAVNYYRLAFAPKIARPVSAK